MKTPNGPRREQIHVGVYVDDLAIVYSHDDDHSLYQSFVAALAERWKVEDEGDLTDLLGIEFFPLDGKGLRDYTHAVKTWGEPRLSVTHR